VLVHGLGGNPADLRNYRNQLLLEMPGLVTLLATSNQVWGCEWMGWDGMCGLANLHQPAKGRYWTTAFLSEAVVR
jgi:hypothetical protein